MKIQIKRNTLSATAQPFSVNAGEPLWYKDRLFVGSVGSSAGGTASSEGAAIEIAKDDDIYMHDGYVFPNAVQDADGNWYDAVVIGDQVWMTHNLMTTKMPDGTPIAQHSSFSSSTPQWYLWQNSYTTPQPQTWDYLTLAGRLYNWPAAVNGTSVSSTPHQGIAPNGWHIPTTDEWRKLIDYLGSKKRYSGANYPSSTGKKSAIQKSISTNGNGIVWTEGSVGINLERNNSTGLNMVCGGQFFDGINSYHARKPWYNGYYWTTETYSSDSTKALRFENYHAPQDSDPDSYYIGSESKSTYLSVRCIANLSPIQFRAWYYNQYGSFNHSPYESIDVIDLRR